MDERALERFLAAVEEDPEALEQELERFVKTRGQPLSPAELRVIEAQSRGLTLAQAADMYGWRYETVRDLAKKARFKLRGKNASHAVANALRRGLIR